MVFTAGKSDCDSIGGIGAGGLALPADLYDLPSAQPQKLCHRVAEQDLGQLRLLDFAA